MIISLALEDMNIAMGIFMKESLKWDSKKEREKWHMPQGLFMKVYGRKIRNQELEGSYKGLASTNNFIF
ncbi:unnamed protein product [Blepharisma stoltei]|uniref:Uncharacterized protein n=1 Tax=Blepharisma stoltei TaxID=1481888 RepID=A0AAU9K290_9CILI|nr:unnamed protein product [Blepharisma stoltei]